MNIFGNFSFGKIIKTFLPGFVIFFSFYSMIDAFLFLYQPEYYPMKFLSQQILFVGFMMIPLSIIFGIISNIVFYVHFTDKYVRENFRNNNEDFSIIEAEFKKALRNKISNDNEFTKMVMQDFTEIDIKYLLMPILPLEKLIHLQEGYWYYLEFIQNLILSIIIFGVSVIFYVSIFWIKMGFSFILIIMTFLFLLLMILLVKLLKAAAIKNYKSHRFKLLSMQIGAYHFAHEKNVSCI